MRKIVISAMIAGAAVLATPAAAAAQNYGGWGNQGNGIAQEINQLQNQVQRAQQRRTISAREATALRRQVTMLQRNFRLYSRNGLDRREVATFQSQVNQVRQGLRAERRDRDNRRG